MAPIAVSRPTTRQTGAVPRRQSIAVGLDRVSAVGRADGKPLAGTAGESGRARTRSGEIVVLPAAAAPP